MFVKKQIHHLDDFTIYCHFLPKYKAIIHNNTSTDGAMLLKHPKYGQAS